MHPTARFRVHRVFLSIGLGMGNCDHSLIRHCRQLSRAGYQMTRGGLRFLAVVHREGPSGDQRQLCAGLGRVGLCEGLGGAAVLCADRARHERLQRQHPACR